MKFLGRKYDVKRLNGFIDDDFKKTLLVYGRRRVGKSELIKQCLSASSIPNIYYECQQVAQEITVRNLSELISEYFHLPRLSFRDMEELLDYLYQKSKEQPFILVLDEYPYLRQKVDGMDSILQSLIDKYKDQTNMKLILCGSFVDVMKSLLSNSNPLYGRIDFSMYIKPMDYYESALFYPNFSNEDKVKTYSFCGGIPFYNARVNDRISVKENMIQLIASNDALLLEEVPMNLNQEISKIDNANDVFSVLAKGYSKYNDILSRSSIKASPTLSDVLNKLIKMEMVQKVAPINAQDNKKRSGYFINDNFTLFYYRYIFNSLSQLHVLPEDVFYERYIKKDFEEQFVPHRFEEICKEYLIRKNKNNELPVAFDLIGKYYYDDPVNKRNGEFDIVTQDPNGYIFYEAKFKNKPVNEEMINKEIKQVDATSLSPYKYGFISKEGFLSEPDDKMIFITLSDLYK